MQSRILCAVFLTAFTLSAGAQMEADKPIPKPKITGISHLAIYTSNAAATEHYYKDVVGAVKMPDPEDPKGVRYALSSTQFIEVLPLPEGAGVNRLDHAAFSTTDAGGLRRWLAHKSYKVPGQVEHGVDGSVWFAVKDPEGNKIQFVQPPDPLKPVAAPNAIGHHIIHVGFLVHSRSTEDLFYRDILGFKPYWYGGMADDKVDWVSQQVPDGHDWLEYMLTSGPSGTGIPADITQQHLGVLNHVSIGEDSVPDTFRTLEAAHRLGEHHDAQPKIGKDGKYQLNLYDPDGTRVEVMNFHATEKPCCSSFTADDPAE